ncbi:MAG TPA: hypothetical protein VG456_27830 [Candidatus Sulfopaludibacter sp.]|jgi:hypothetical protein|nr:hypothetical protein [Candidatus Sulfopaludibacter sp.]
MAKIPRLLLLLCLAAAARADSALDVHNLFEDAAHALGDGKPAGFLSAFDPAMPGFAKLRANVTELVRASDVRSTIEWQTNDGDDQTRRVQLDWQMEIDERGGASSVTHRRVRVECQMKKEAGGWRIVSFTPADLFAPPQVDEAWNVVVTLALDLPGKFTQTFDPAMEGYARLQDNIASLDQGVDVESSVDLVKNEGDDKLRTIVVDWTMNLVSKDTTVATAKRRETVTCTVAKQGKSWRITSIAPRSIFAPR